MNQEVRNSKKALGVMENFAEIVEKLKAEGHSEVPFSFFIEASFEIMEFWDCITDVIKTPTKVDAKGWDVRYITTNTPHYDNFRMPTEEMKAKLKPEDYTRKLYDAIKYTRVNYDTNNLDLAELQEILSKDVKTQFKEVLEAGYVLTPYIEFHRGSNIGAVTITNRKLTVKTFAKLFEDLKDCQVIAYFRDTEIQVEVELPPEEVWNERTESWSINRKIGMEKQTIKHSHLMFELYRNDVKRFESAHKNTYIVPAGWGKPKERKFLL